MRITSLVSCIAVLVMCLGVCPASVQAVTVDYERKERRLLDDSVTSDFEYLETVAEGYVSVVSRTFDDGQWVVSYSNDNAPTRYYRYDRDAKRAHFLFTTVKALARLRSRECILLLSERGTGSTWLAT